MLLTFASTHGGGEEEEEEQEQRGPWQPPAAPQAAWRGGRGGLLVAELSHDRGAPCSASPPAGHALAPFPNFLSLPDTWTSISLTHGGHVTRPAHPCPSPRHPPTQAQTPLISAGDSAPLPPRGQICSQTCCYGCMALLGFQTQGWAASRAFLHDPPLRETSMP